MTRLRKVPSSARGGTVRPAAAGAAAAALATGRQTGAEPPKDLAGALEKIPAKDLDTAVQVCKELIAGGAGTVKRLIDLVGDEFGDAAGVKPKYALHGVVIYAGRPKADAERKMVARTLARELASGRSAEAKAFLCRQLQLCGGSAEVPALAGLLRDNRLCEPATQALLAIGGKGPAAALRAALPKATGKRRATIIKALGRLRDKPSASMVRWAASDADQDVRLMAWYALGNMGVAEAGEHLVKAAGDKAGFERTQAADAALRLARRLAQEGSAVEAGRLCRQLLADAKGPERFQQRCAALHGLATALGVKAVGDVMAALEADELKYRIPAARTAVKLAKSIHGDHPTEARKLLRKVLKATGEKAVLRQAETLLAKAGK